MTGNERPPPSAAAFIFDLDGTLVDSGRDIARAANHAREQGGLPPLPEAAVLRYVGDGAPALLRRVLGHAADGAAPRPVGEAELAAGLAAFREHYAAHLVDATALYPGAREALAALAPAPLAVATNKPAAFARPLLERLGVAHLFRRVVAADDVVRRKPDPGHLAACLEGLDPEPSAVIVVGDSRNDILAARALGAVAVAVTWGLTPAAELRAEAPDFLLGSFAELARRFGPGGPRP